MKSLDPAIKQGKWQFYFTGTRSKLAQICDLFTTGNHIVTLKILCNTGLIVIGNIYN